MQGQEQRQDSQASELEANRRELQRQRQELDALRRDRYSAQGQDPQYYHDQDRYNDPQYDNNSRY
jgi:hypothetical protein